MRTSQVVCARGEKVILLSRDTYFGILDFILLADTVYLEHRCLVAYVIRIEYVLYNFSGRGITLKNFNAFVKFKVTKQL